MPVCQNNLIVFGNALFKRPLVGRSRFLPDPSFGRPSSLVFRPLLFSRPLVTLFPELALIVFLLAPFLRPLLHFSVPVFPRYPSLRITPLRVSPYPAASPQLSMPHLSVPHFSAPRPLFPFRPFPLSCPSVLPVKPIIRLFQKEKRGKRRISGKKRPEKFFREECDEELYFSRTRVIMGA